MAARRYTASIVITLALAPGCAGGGSNQPHRNPPEPHQNPPGPEPSATPTATGTDTPTTNPPEPEPKVRIDRRADNTCWRVVDVDCPPNAACNPPPPTQVDCESKQPINPDNPPRR